MSSKQLDGSKSSSKAPSKMFASAQRAAMAAADTMWARTKVVRSKFPSGRTTLRKPSFVWSSHKQLESAIDQSDDEALYYDSMRDLWEDDILKQPVAKDLPRLIRRICVVNQEEEILFLPAGGRVPDRHWPSMPKETVEQPAQEPSEEDDQVPAEDEGDDNKDDIVVDGEEDDKDGVSGAEDETQEVSDVEMGDKEKDPGVEEMEEPEKEDRKSKRRTKSRVSFKEKVDKVRRSSRLSRWSLLKRKSSPKEADLNTNAAIFKLIFEFVEVLASRLESEEECLRITEELLKIQEQVSDASDMQLVVKDVIETIGAESKIARVLKTIHQNIILHSTVQLKQKLTMKYNTKDIRTGDGWRIVVMLAKGYIQVAHIRKEQSLDAFGNTKDHWEFEWEVRMTFDDRMSNMTAAQIRITRLILGETMREDLAEELKATLVDGLIVL